MSSTTLKRIGPSEVLAETTSGKVVGRVLNDGKYQFLGVPYAASPNAPERRFMRPVEYSPWPGVRDATTYGPSSPQPVIDYWGRPNNDLKRAWPNGGNWYALFAPNRLPGDDYLNLNITSPGSSSELLPVVVFIHGGAFNLGNNAMVAYRGDKIADLDVLFVSINYRLGAEGFWRIRGGDSNVGLRDQIFALEWIKENISGFGGDPTNVTILGQSAGAQSAGLLSVSPKTKGLFHRVVAHSHAVPGAKQPDDSFEDSARLGLAIGVESDREAASVLDPDEIVRRIHGATLNPVHRCPHGRMDYSTILVPHVDDDVVLSSFRDDFSTVKDDRPIITGITADESSWRVYQTGAYDTWTEVDLIDYLRGLVSEPTKVLSRLRELHPGASPADLKARVMYYDMYMRIMPVLDSRSLSGRKATHAYLFAERSVAGGGKYGAFHLADLPFLFNILDDPSAISMMGGRGSQRTADAMRDSWRSFFYGEDPSWPSYDPDLPTIKVFEDGESGFIRSFGDREFYDYWSSVRI